MFHPASAWKDVEMHKSTNIGIKGIHVSRLDLPKCGIARVSMPGEIKWKYDKAAIETSQSFYFNGKDRISHVFVNSYSWSYVSIPFVTKITHTLDEIKVNCNIYSGNEEL